MSERAPWGAVPSGAAAPAGAMAAATPTEAPAARALATGGAAVDWDDGRVNILLVDDQPESLLAMGSVLEELGQNLIQARSGREALRHLLTTDFAVVLLDIRMASMDGFETAAMIRERERSKNTPIIFLTAGHKDDLHIFRGYALGAVDYLFKPIVPEILRSKVKVFVDLALARARLERLARAQEMRADSSEDKYRRLMDQADDAILVLDSQGTVLECNPRASRMLAPPGGSVLGARFEELLDPGGDVPAARALVRSGSGRLHDLLCRGADGVICADVSVSRLAVGDDTFVLVIARDVTERRQAEDHIRRLNDDLERRVIERTAELETSNQELEAFSYSVAHDLRAPLRTIIGYSQILAQDAKGLAAEDRQHLGAIAAATVRMDQLIDDLLDLSRVTRVEMDRRRVDLSAVVREIAAEFAKQDAARSVEFRVQDGLEAVGDARLLRTALENLVSNAWKFTSRQPAARIEFGLTAEGEYYVRDNGVGFDMRHVGKLFGAFQRLHIDDFDGTGIGLAIVQRVVLRHGGAARAEGEVGQGATFYFSLPPASGRDGAEAVAAGTRPV